MLGREHFSGLLDIVGDLVWSFSLDGQRLLYVNPAATNFYDASLDQLLETSGLWLDSIHHDDQQELKEKLADINHLIQFDQQFRIVQSDGTQNWLQGHFCLIRNEAGKPDSIGGTAHDVTKRMRTVGDWLLVALYYLLCIGEYTVKAEQSQSKQTKQFKMKDVHFFCKNKHGNLCLLHQNASEDAIMDADGATLKV